MGNGEKRKLSAEEVVVSGVLTDHKLMFNGDRRFRLVDGESGAYAGMAVITEGAWANSHYHKNVIEIVAVIKGWVAFAELKDGKLNIRILRENESLTLCHPGLPHNMYMSANTRMVGIKLAGTTVNNPSEVDWYASPEMDALTKHLTEEQILALAIKV